MFAGKLFRRSIHKVEHDNQAENISLLAFDARKFVYFNTLLGWIHGVEVNRKVGGEWLFSAVHHWFQFNAAVEVL